jgi:hypothetical protein
MIGVCMPYHHPVAVVLSALWWGLYLGCFGASVGALIALCTERAPHKPEREHCPERMDGQAENQSLLVIRPGASKE